MKRVALRVLAPYIALACALFLPKLWWPTAALYSRPAWSHALDLVGFLGMFAPLAVGAVFAVGAARRLDRGNRARPAWHLLSGWLVCFSAGEAIIGSYNYVFRVAPPLPSAGDAFFVTGYVLLALGAASFVRVYATSGMPIGSPRALVVIGVVATLTLGALGGVVVGPLFRTPHALPEVLISAGYPLLDFVVMVPMAVLVRITLPFQGGRVRAVWTSILAGFALLAGADLLFAEIDLRSATSLDPLLIPLFMTGYALTAYGAALQFDLVGPAPERKAGADPVSGGRER